MENLFSAEKKAKQQIRTDTGTYARALSEWNRTGYRNTLEPRWLKRDARRQIKTQILFHLVLLTAASKITPQSPSTGNQKCDLMWPGSHYSGHTLPPTTTLGTSNNPESFPEKLLLCLQAVTNEGNYRTSIATLDLSQGISDGRFGGGGLQGNVMFQPVLPGKRTTNIFGWLAGHPC